MITFCTVKERVYLHVMFLLPAEVGGGEGESTVLVGICSQRAGVHHHLVTVLERGIRPEEQVILNSHRDYFIVLLSYYDTSWDSMIWLPILLSCDLKIQKPNVYTHLVLLSAERFKQSFLETTSERLGILPALSRACFRLCIASLFVKPFRV